VIHCVNQSSAMVPTFVGAAKVSAKVVALSVTRAKDRAKLLAPFVTPAEAGAQAKNQECLDPGVRRGDESTRDFASG
jgi:hypothetical protein